jgi:drug/metabolite transporter (DMT)-like permease
MNNQKKSYLFAISAILLWSTVSTAFKISLEKLGFVQLLFVSSSIATLILFAIVLIQKKTNQIFSSPRNILNSALVGFLNPFAYYLVLLKAYSVLPAQIAQPLNYTWPIVLVLLSAPLLKQKLYLKSIIALIISFTGVFIIASQGNFTTFKIDNPLGIFLATGSSIIWALFWILNIKDKRDETVKLFLNFFFGTIYTFVVLIVFFEIRIEFSKSLISAIYVGFFEMGITFVLWLKALQYAKSNEKINNLVYISPFMALIFIHFILKEEILYTTLIGLIFIITGILVQQISKNK